MGAELDYELGAMCRLSAGPVRLLCAQALLESVMERAGDRRLSACWPSCQRCGNWKIWSLSIRSIEREIPVLLGDHVTTDAGTGCVHTAPDHGMEDFTVAAANATLAPSTTCAG